MPTKCRLLGELVSSAGVPIPLARVTFTPKDGAIRPLPPLTIVPEVETGRTDENGQLLALDGGPFEVYPGVYSIRVKQGLHPAYPTMTGTVPEAETALLSDIQNLTPPVPLNEAQLAVLAAQQARDQARDAAGEAAAGAIAQVSAELDEKVAAAEQAREGAETAAGTAAAAAAAEVEVLLDGKVQAAETARSGAAGSAGTATTQAGIAGAAKTAAETARDASIVNAQTYATEALGRAAVVDGATFDVQGAGDVASYRYRRTNSTTSVLIASFPSAARIGAGYVKEQETLAAGAYDERFAFFDLSSQSYTNLTDAAVVTPDVKTKTADGLRFVLNTAGKTVAASTGNKIGPGISRCKYRASVEAKGATCHVGVACFDGARRWSVQIWQNGWILWQNGVDPTLTLTTGAGAWSVGAVHEIEVTLDAATGEALILVSRDGGAPRSFGVAGAFAGDVELIQRGASTVTHRLLVSGVAGIEMDTIRSARSRDIPAEDRGILGAAKKLLSTLKRSVPVGFTAPMPADFNVYKSGAEYFTSVDLRPVLDEFDPLVAVYHVDIDAGLDTNPGTAAAPLKSLNFASYRIGAGVKAIIKAKGGLYPLQNAFGPGAIAGAVVQIVSWDGLPVISSKHDTGLTWSINSGTTYQAAYADGIASVFDAGILTADGDYSPVNLAASLALCQSTPGSYFLSAGVIYVNLSDGREPDDGVRVYKKAASGTSGNYNLWFQASDQIVYLENIICEGGHSPLTVTSASETLGVTLYAKDCEFKYGGGSNGTNWTSPGLVIFQDCLAALNSQDGFNYKPITGSSVKPLCIEIDCEARWNGMEAGGTNNGTTGHGCDLIRVNGDYHHNQNRNVHDIWQSVGSLSWNLGCTSRDSTSGTNSVNWAAGISGETAGTVVWLDGCVSLGSATDLQANSPALIYISNLTSGGAITGDVTAYTP